MSCPGPDARHYRGAARCPILDRMQSAIEIDGLRKAYGDVEAVRDISFSVAAGEVFCLLGPNGAGKTTTTEILEGYRARSAGHVRVLGHDPEDGERARRERVGIVLQEAAAQAELTVTEVLTMYGRYYPRRRPAGELVELVGLVGKEDQRVKLLSGGQRRRPPLTPPPGRPPPPPGPPPAPRRRPRPALPRRADHRLRPVGAPPGVDDDQGPLRAGQDGLPHHPLHGRGAGAGRPRGRHGRRAHRRPRHARRDRRPRHRADRDRLRAPRPRRPQRPAGARRRPGHRGGAGPRARGDPRGAALCPRADRLGPRARPRAARLRREPALAGGRLPSTDREPGGHDPMTAMSETLERPAEARDERTGDVALTAWQVAYEQRAFWRNRTRAFFSLGMPVMLLLLFGALNSGGRIQELGNIPYVTFFLPGILAYGIVITQFVNMAGGIAIQRDNGLLKRMRGTPLPGWAYVTGRLGSTALVSVVMTVVMLVIGRVGFDVHLRAAAVPAVVVTVLLGAATFAALGLAAVMIIPNAEAAPVVANVLILPLSFISGIWYPLTGAPDWIVDVAKFFPLEHLANALHVAFDPLNHGSAWSGNDLFVLGIWLLVGTRLAMRFWEREMAR